MKTTTWLLVTFVIIASYCSANYERINYDEQDAWAPAGNAHCIRLRGHDRLCKTMHHGHEVVDDPEERERLFESRLHKNLALNEYMRHRSEQ